MLSSRMHTDYCIDCHWQMLLVRGVCVVSGGVVSWGCVCRRMRFWCTPLPLVYTRCLWCTLQPLVYTSPSLVYTTTTTPPGQTDAYENITFHCSR